MQVIGPRLTDLAVLHRHRYPGLRPVRGSFLCAAQGPLRPGELASTAAQVPRAGDQFTVRRRGQHVEPEVHANVAFARRQRHRGGLHHERGVVPAVRLADHGDTGRDRWQRPGPADRQVPHLRHVQPVPVQGEPVAGEADRLPVILPGPEPGVADRAALPFPRQRIKPVPVRAPRVLARLHQRHRRDLTQPHPPRGQLGQRDHPPLHHGVADLLPARVTPPAVAGSRCTPPGHSRTPAPGPAAAPATDRSGTGT